MATTDDERCRATHGEHVAIGVETALVIDGIEVELGLEPTRVTFSAEGSHVVVECVGMLDNNDDVTFVAVVPVGGRAPAVLVPSQDAFNEQVESGAWSTGVTRWAITARGERIATAWDGEGLAIRDVATGKRTRVLMLPDEDGDLDVEALAFNAAGTQLAVLVPGSLDLYDVTFGKRLGQVDIDETFGESTLEIVDDTHIRWTRRAPGVDDTRVIEL